MLRFIITKQFFEQYKSGKQDVELRSMRPKWKNSRVGNQAVLICGKDILMKRILEVHTGSLARILLNVNYSRIFADARTIFEANRWLLAGGRNIPENKGQMGLSV